MSRPGETFRRRIHACDADAEWRRRVSVPPRICGISLASFQSRSVSSATIMRSSAQESAPLRAPSVAERQLIDKCVAQHCGCFVRVAVFSQPDGPGSLHPRSCPGRSRCFCVVDGAAGHLVSLRGRSEQRGSQSTDQHPSGFADCADAAQDVVVGDGAWSSGAASGPRINCSSGPCGGTRAESPPYPRAFGECRGRQPISAYLPECVAGWKAYSQVTSVCSSALEHGARKSGRFARHLCARGDLNPHVRGHWNLNPARLPIPPLARDGTTVQTLPAGARITKPRGGVVYPRVTRTGIITIWQLPI